jgi:hypothetical protein
MFNSAVLDLAVGLIFTFLTVSLATGTIVEAIASFLKLRAKTLREGIGQLLNDTSYSGLAKEIYAHAVVNPRGDGTPASASKSNKNDPAYIDRQLFGQAMLDILKISPEIANAATNVTAPLGKPTMVELKAAVDGALQAAATAQGKTMPDPQLQRLLHGIIERSLGDPDKIKGELVAWFDNAMDRVSGWYKRWTQLIGFIAALFLAAGLNINAIGVAQALWTQPKLAQELDLPKALPAGDETQAPALLHQLDTTLPVGWVRSLSCRELGIAFLGWLITALSTLFGAPFWFDLLQTVIRLKGSGPSPVEKVDGKGASA